MSHLTSNVLPGLYLTMYRALGNIFSLCHRNAKGLTECFVTYIIHCSLDFLFASQSGNVFLLHFPVLEHNVLKYNNHNALIPLLTEHQQKSVNVLLHGLISRTCPWPYLIITCICSLKLTTVYVVLK